MDVSSCYEAMTTSSGSIRIVTLLRNVSEGLHPQHTYHGRGCQAPRSPCAAGAEKSAKRRFDLRSLYGVIVWHSKELWDLNGGGRMRAKIDFGAAGGVDVARLERSLGLRARRVGAGRYRVEGGAEPHWVDLHTAQHPRCDCGDHLWRERICKHILAAMLREGDERVLQAVAGLVARLRALAEAA